MKVCHLCPDALLIENGGGLASYLYGLISSTHRRIRYWLITGYDREDLPFSSTLYESIAQSLYKDKAEICFIHSRSLLLDLLVLGGYYRNLRRCDIVQFNDFYRSRDIIRYSLLILLLKALSRVRIVFGFRTAGTGESIPHSSLRGLYTFLFRRVSACWDRVVCPSNYMANIIMGRYGIPRNKISVIPNGVDVELYQEADAVILAGSPAILFVGHLQPSKGADLVLRAFRLLNQEIPSSCLHLVGRGKGEREYEELIHELDIQGKVQLHGRKSRKELSRIYKGADICVFPSRVEAFGNVLLEAMASGKPIVATNVGGIPEIITQDRNGLLVEPRTESVGRALLKLARDHALCEMMRKNNEHDAIGHSWKHTAEMYVNLYEQICMLDGAN